MQPPFRTSVSAICMYVATCALAIVVPPRHASTADEHQNGQAAVGTAALFLEQGKVAEACKLLKAVTVQMPTWWVAHYDYVRCAKLLKPNWHELRDHIQTALATDPDKASLYYELGLIELELGQFDAAIVALENALALSPKFHEPRRKIADAYWALGNLPKAREGLEAQVRDSPNDLVAANRLVDVYLHEHMYKEAATVLESIAIRSRFPAHSWAKLAKIYEKIGDMASYRRTMLLIDR